MNTEQSEWFEIQNVLDIDANTLTYVIIMNKKFISGLRMKSFRIYVDNQAPPHYSC